MRGSVFFAGLVALSFVTGCAEVAPIPVTPTIAASEVRDDLDIFCELDRDKFLAAVKPRMAPATLDKTLIAHFRAPPRAAWELDILHKSDVRKVLVALKSKGPVCGLVMPRAPNDNLIAPVEWLHKVVSFPMADDAAARAWYIEMSERLATNGTASGIAVFSNGNAMGIVLELRVESSGDQELVAQTRLLRVGQYDAAEWGPRFDGPESVVTAKMNGHEGITLHDLLRLAMQNIAGQNPTAPIGTEL